MVVRPIYVYTWGVGRWEDVGGLSRTRSSPKSGRISAENGAVPPVRGHSCSSAR
jgi:hypothetical protein